MRSVGPGLERVAREVAARVHGTQGQTVIHGDAKIANFFFRDPEAAAGLSKFVFKLQTSSRGATISPSLFR